MFSAIMNNFNAVEEIPEFVGQISLAMTSASFFTYLKAEWRKYRQGSRNQLENESCVSEEELAEPISSSELVEIKKDKEFQKLLLNKEKQLQYVEPCMQIESSNMLKFDFMTKNSANESPNKSTKTNIQDESQTTSQSLTGQETEDEPISSRSPSLWDLTAAVSKKLLEDDISDGFASSDDECNEKFKSPIASIRVEETINHEDSPLNTENRGSRNEPTGNTVQRHNVDLEEESTSDNECNEKFESPITSIRVEETVNHKDSSLNTENRGSRNEPTGSTVQRHNVDLEEESTSDNECNEKFESPIASSRVEETINHEDSSLNTGSRNESTGSSVQQSNVDSEEGSASFGHNNTATFNGMSSIPLELSDDDSIEEIQILDHIIPSDHKSAEGIVDKDMSPFYDDSSVEFIADFPVVQNETIEIECEVIIINDNNDKNGMSPLYKKNSDTTTESLQVQHESMKTVVKNSLEDQNKSNEMDPLSMGPHSKYENLKHKELEEQKSNELSLNESTENEVTIIYCSRESHIRSSEVYSGDCMVEIPTLRKSTNIQEALFDQSEHHNLHRLSKHKCHDISISPKEDISSQDCNVSDDEVVEIPILHQNAHNSSLINKSPTKAISNRESIIKGQHSVEINEIQSVSQEVLTKYLYSIPDEQCKNSVSTSENLIEENTNYCNSQLDRDFDDRAMDQDEFNEAGTENVETEQANKCSPLIENMHPQHKVHNELLHEIEKEIYNSQLSTENVLKFKKICLGELHKLKEIRDKKFIDEVVDDASVCMDSQCESSSNSSKNGRQMLETHSDEEPESDDSLVRVSAQKKVCKRVDYIRKPSIEVNGQLSNIAMTVESQSAPTPEITKDMSHQPIAQLQGENEMFKKSGGPTQVLAKEDMGPILTEIFYTSVTSYVFKNAQRCIKLLEEYPEAVNITNKLNGFTPFLSACWTGSVTLVRHMLECGANVDIRSRGDGDTAMYIAVRALVESDGRPNCNLLKLLLDKGCSINAANKLGQTPLHLAAACGSKRVVKWLLDHGASPYIRNAARHRPIHLAQEAEHSKVVSMLKIDLAEESDSSSDISSSSSSASSFRSRRSQHHYVSRDKSEQRHIVASSRASSHASSRLRIRSIASPRPQKTHHRKWKRSGRSRSPLHRASSSDSSRSSSRYSFGQNSSHSANKKSRNLRSSCSRMDSCSSSRKSYRKKVARNTSYKKKVARNTSDDGSSESFCSTNFSECSKMYKANSCCSCTRECSVTPRRSFRRDKSQSRDLDQTERPRRKSRSRSQTPVTTSIYSSSNVQGLTSGQKARDPRLNRP